MPLSIFPSFSFLSDPIDSAAISHMCSDELWSEKAHMERVTRFNMAALNEGRGRRWEHGTKNKRLAESSVLIRVRCVEKKGVDVWKASDWTWATLKWELSQLKHQMLVSWRFPSLANHVKWCKHVHTFIPQWYWILNSHWSEGVDEFYNNSEQGKSVRGKAVYVFTMEGFALSNFPVIWFFLLLT